MYDKKAAVEAILFANGSPVEPDKIAHANFYLLNKYSARSTAVSACSALA